MSKVYLESEINHVFNSDEQSLKIGQYIGRDCINVDIIEGYDEQLNPITRASIQVRTKDLLEALSVFSGLQPFDD